MAVTTAGAPLKKMTFDGKPVKMWYHDGSLVYRSSVAVRNVLSAAATANAACDLADVDRTYTLLTQPSTPGHYYYIRGIATVFGQVTHYSGKAIRVWQGGTHLASFGDGAEQGVVVKATGTALTVELYGNGACDAGVSAGFNGKLYMFCDITGTGITDADAFWAACGKAVFYGTKEIEV